MTTQLERIDKTDQARKRVTEYDILRVIATLLVVLGHATYLSHVSAYGGCDYLTASSDPSLFHRAVSRLASFIYLFHMPLFMALSGAIFSRSFARKKYNFSMLLIEKGKRLLIPFFIVGALYAFPLKCLAGYYAHSNHLFRDFLLGQMFIRDDTHLWFLPTLFAIYIICYLAETYWPGHTRWKLCLMFCAYLLNRLLERHWQTPMEMTLWFYLGYQFENVRYFHGGGGDSGNTFY